MKELKQGTFNMEFSLDNVDYQISLSNTKSEEDGVLAEKYKAELKAGPKKVVLEKTINGGDVDYNIRGEGPGMDDEAERMRFLRTWSLVVFGQLQRHSREINGTDQDDQFKQSMTSFLKLYKHFFEPRLLSLINENPDSDGSEISDTNHYEGSFSAIPSSHMGSNSGIPENAMPSSSMDSDDSGNDADDLDADSDNDTNDMDSDSGNDADDDINSDIDEDSSSDDD